MRVSFCSIGFQEKKWGKDVTIDRPLREIIPLLREGGYDGVEIWYPHVGTLKGDELAAVRDQLRDAGLAVPMLSSYYNFTTSDETCAESLAHGREVLEKAVYLGARAIRIFTGKTASADATPQQWYRCVAALQKLADAAAPHGIRLACETHAWNLMDTLDSTLELMHRVSRTNVGVILQPSTFKEDYLRATMALASFAVHVHATNSKDGKGSGLAEGVMDYRMIIQKLHMAGFRGFVSVEWMGASPEEKVRTEGPYLKGLITEAAAMEKMPAGGEKAMKTDELFGQPRI